MWMLEDVVCTVDARCTTLWKRETRRQTVKDVRTRTGSRGSDAGDRLQGVRGWEMMVLGVMPVARPRDGWIAS
jgi:hypothetical protein